MSYKTVDANPDKRTNLTLGHVASPRWQRARAREFHIVLDLHDDTPSSCSRCLPPQAWAPSCVQYFWMGRATTLSDELPDVHCKRIAVIREPADRHSAPEDGLHVPSGPTLCQIFRRPQATVCSPCTRSLPVPWRRAPLVPLTTNRHHLVICLITPPVSPLLLLRPRSLTYLVYGTTQAPRRGDPASPRPQTRRPSLESAEGAGIRLAPVDEEAPEMTGKTREAGRR